MKQRKDVKKVEKLKIEVIDENLVCNQSYTETVTIVEVKQDSFGKEKVIRVIDQKIVKEEEKVLWTRKLRKVDIKELQKLRKTGKPGFVLKEDGEYWYTKITADDHVGTYNLMGEDHLCASKEGTFCGRFYPAPEDKGGCSKVWGRPQCIEKFPFIKRGYESFNTTANALVVLECTNYFRNIHKKHEGAETDFKSVLDSTHVS